MDANSVRNMYSIIAVTNKHIAKFRHVGSLYILTYDARKIKHKIGMLLITIFVEFRVVAGRSRTRAGSLQAVSRRLCCALA
jgi:hypothetical protein